MSNRRFLKVKIKTLACEVTIIRKEENSLPGGHWLRASLQQHRKKVVCEELRSALIAYGFLRGRSYTQIESGSTRKPNMDRVREIVTKFNDPRKATTQQTLQKLAEWQDALTVSIKENIVAKENKRAAYFSSVEYAEHQRIKNLSIEEKQKIRLDRKLAFMKGRNLTGETL